MRNSREVLILGSQEHVEYGKSLQRLLSTEFYGRRMPYQSVLWSEPYVWENGQATLTSLIHKAEQLRRENGFVIAVFTPDDRILLRGKEQYCSRDNVWLEYGLFVGAMGASRVFAICPSQVFFDTVEMEWRRPTDFNEYYLRYIYNSSTKDIDGALRSAANEIVTRINNLFPNVSQHRESDLPNSGPEFRVSY